MYKKIIIIFLIFFAPFAIIEQQQKDQSSKLNIKKFNMDKKNNFHLAENLIETNQDNGIEVKNCWEELDFASQNDIAYLPKNFKSF